MGGDAQEPWERLATNLRVEGALLSALDLLRDFPVVVFKGAVLTRLIYGDLRQRASADNDLWVRSARSHAALDHLLAHGYEPLLGLDPHAALRRVGQVALWPHGDLEQPSLDLHEAAFSSRFFRASERALSEHLMEVELHGRRVLTFDRPLALCHQVAHWVQHHLDPAHLPTIADSWSAWRRTWLTSTSGLSALGQQTCTEEALSLALALAHPQASPPLPLPGRARFIHSGIEGWGLPSHHLLRKLSSLFLVAPHRLPEGMLGALLLEPDELRSRYGSGSRARLIGHHLWASLRR